MTREDSDSRLMTRDSTRDSAPGKSNDSGLDSRLDSHDLCTALIVVDFSYLVYDSRAIDATAARHAMSVEYDLSIGTDTHIGPRQTTEIGSRRAVAGSLTGTRILARYHSSGTREL